jgi:hypothetical protein
MGPVGCPETSLRNYQYSLHNDAEVRSSLGVYKVYVMRFASMMYFLSIVLNC